MSPRATSHRETPSSDGLLRRLFPIARQLADYRAAWLSADILAGLSVAAVALPTAIAYPAIAGLPPETGLYAAILPPIGYALFGPSRQLMVGPDTATTIMLASVLAGLALAAPDQRVAAAAVFALTVGLCCVVAGFVGLGFIANFLSRPVLMGFLSGVAIDLFIGQLDRLTAVPVQSSGLARPLFEFATKVDQVHLPTLLVGAGLFAGLRLLRRVAPRVPGPLLAVAAGILPMGSMGQLAKIDDLESLYLFSEESRIPTVMTFGKFKGEPISAVDRGYMNWYRRQPDTDPYVLEAFRRNGM